MFKKLKIKFCYKKLKKSLYFLFFLFLLFGFLFISGNEVQAALCQQQNKVKCTPAELNSNPIQCDSEGFNKTKNEYQTCDLSEIKVKVDTYLNGSNNPGNFLRVGADTSFTIKVKATLVSPDEIATNKDELNFANADDPEFVGFGAGIKSSIDTAEYKCEKDSKTREYSFGFRDVTSYIKCSFPKSLDFAQTGGSRIFKVGQVVYDHVYTVSASNFEELGLSETGRKSIKIYPTLYYGSWGADQQIVLDNAAQEVFLEVYATEAEARAADQAEGRPSDVPAYSGATGASSGGDLGQGSGLLGFFNQIIGIIIGFISQLVYGIFFLLVAPLIEGILHIRTYTDSFAAVIYPGWEVLRNVSNIFFIVALIAIGLGTLFRIESYQFKHLLVQLMIAALMVNFSLVLGQAVLGIADTVQNQFMPDSRGVVRDLGKELIASYSPSVVYKLDYEANGYFANTVAPLFYLALSIGSFLVFAAVGAYLLIRIVALWVLLMISPLAYVAGILPSTSHYRTEWWTTFLKYAFFTPIMAFFLNMAAIMVNTYKNNSILQDVLDRPQDILGANSDVGAFFFKVSSNILILVFLVIALKVAEQAGIYGASTITNIAQKGIAAPFALTGKGVKLGVGAVARTYTKAMTKGIDRNEKAGNKGKERFFRAAQFLNPEVVKRAYEARVKEKEAEAYEPAIGHTRDTINRVIPTEWEWKRLAKGKLPKLGQRTYYGRVGQAAMIAHKRSEWEKIPLSEEEKVKAALAVHHPEDIEALQYIIQDGRHEDGLMIAWMQKHKPEMVEKLKARYKKKGKDQEGNTLSTDKEINDAAERDAVAYYDAVSYTDVITDMMKHAGMSSEQIGETLSHLQEHAEANAKERGLGYALYDEWDGNFRAINDFSGYKKLEGKEGSQAMLVDLERTKIFKEHKDADGNVTKLTYQVKDEFGEDVVGESYDIKNFKDLEDTMGILSKKYDVDFDYNMVAGDLRYKLMGARKNMDAQKRKERGNTETWAGAIEPAAIKRQYEDGTFRGFTSYGRTSVSRRPAATVIAVGRSRRLQDRAVKNTGIYKNMDGEYDLRPMKRDGSGGSIDYNEMAQYIKLNPSEAFAFVSKAGLRMKDLKEIKATLEKDYSKYLKDINWEDVKMISETDSKGATFGFKENVKNGEVSVAGNEPTIILAGGGGKGTKTNV